MAKILLMPVAPIDVNMAGTGARYWEIARQLSIDHEVTLITPNESQLTSSEFRVEVFSYKKIFKLIKEHEIIISNRLRKVLLFYLLFTDKRFVLDMFDNLHVAENLEIFSKNNPKIMDKVISLHLETHVLHIYLSDFMVCANERHRDFSLGILFKVGKITKEYYLEDETLRSLIDLMPIGLPAEAPQHNKQVLKGAWAGIEEDDFVLLWIGGIWDWYDPISLIWAMTEVVQKAPKVKLFFLGCAAPSPNSPKHKIFSETKELSKNLGLLDKNIFFSGWVSYEERVNYLLEADAGITTYLETLESRFATRARYYDYFWTELPVICSKGDFFPELVEREKLGITVEGGNVEQITRAILELYSNKEFYQKCKDNLKSAKKQYTWKKVTEPLKRYCSSAKTKKKIPLLPFLAGCLKSTAIILSDIGLLKRFIKERNI